MPKQTITTEIEVPDDGYEFVRLEPFMQDGNTCYLPIFRKAWQWPEWLLAPWIAMDKGGSWYAYTEEPQEDSTAAFSGGVFNPIDCEVFDFTPPPCGDWKQSKRRNPNLENNYE